MTSTILLGGICAQGFWSLRSLLSLAFCTHNTEPHPQSQRTSYVCPPIIWEFLEKGLGLPSGTPSPKQSLAHSEYWVHHKSELGFPFSQLFCPSFHLIFPSSFSSFHNQITVRLAWACEETRLVPQSTGGHNFPILLSEKPDLSPFQAPAVYISAVSLFHDVYGPLWHIIFPGRAYSLKSFCSSMRDNTAAVVKDLPPADDVI